MVVAGPEGLHKNQYRKFNIRSEDLTPGDDFGMMREVLAAPLQAADARGAAALTFLTDIESRAAGGRFG